MGINVICAVIAIILMMLRIFVHPGTPTLADVYKDIAHIFVGMMLAGMLIQKLRWQKTIFWMLCAWEVFIAIGSRFLWIFAFLFVVTFSGCATAQKPNPNQYNVAAQTTPQPGIFTRIGQTGEHTATAIRVGWQEVVGGLSLFRIKLSATGSIEFDAVAFDNRNPFPSETVKQN